MKIIKKILSLLTIAIFALAFFIIISSTIQMRKRQVPRLFGFSYFTVATQSMEPVIKVNDFIIVKKANEYQIDDIVSFYYDVNNDGKKEVVTHKIIKIENNIITTHGVNNPLNQNEEIKASDIIGKVVIKSTTIGKMLSNKYIQNKVYILGFIILCLFIIVGYQVVKILKILKKDGKSE